MEKIILLGCGGHAKSIVDAIESQGKFEIVGFTGTEEYSDFAYRNYKVIGDDRELVSLYNSGVANAFVCIGYMGTGKVRSKLFERLKEIGFHLPVIIDKTAAIALDAGIGEGTFIGKNTVVNSDARIGKMAIINTSAVVEHDCSVGDFSHIAVGAVLCGNVSVGTGCLIGANATVIQGKSIENDVIIGAGSTILRDVKTGETAVGIVR